MEEPFAKIDKISLSSDQHEWVKAQELLKRRVVLEDDFKWTIPTQEFGYEGSFEGDKLRYIGGVDLSFFKEDPSMACGALVVVDLDKLNVVHNDFSISQLQIPYVPGFLAFREGPILLELLKKMKHDANPFYPQLLMVDGNGLLHPRGFGLACHIGVMADIPTIGIGKNRFQYTVAREAPVVLSGIIAGSGFHFGTLHHVDGLTQSGVRELLEAKSECSKDVITLTGDSGCIWGAAMRSTRSSSKPIFISIGHRISLETAIQIVRMCCKYRIPEPIRQADIRSRGYLQKQAANLLK